MAVDKKSQHVGNHGGAYTDIDGQSKQFTYIDHDVKPTIGTYTSDHTIFETVKKDRENLIQRILLIPAVYCPAILGDFTLRGDVETVEWNKVMLRDAGLPLQRLHDIHSLTRNRMSLIQEGIMP